jgi:hypothetical protein
MSRAEFNMRPDNGGGRRFNTEAVFKIRAGVADGFQYEGGFGLH